MQLKTLLRTVILGGALISLLLVFAACESAAAEPQIIEKEVIREVPKIEVVEKEVQVPVEVQVEKEVIREVPVEVVREVPRDVLVEKEVVKIKEVMVRPTPIAMPGKRTRVQPARASWDTGYFQEALYRLALEELGYDVQDHQELDAPLFYLAVAQGDVDFWANGWVPLHSQFEETWSEGAEIAGDVIPGGGVQGYLADKASVDKFGIMTLDDFTRPEVKEAFDHDGDGKADLYGCPPGWGCHGVINHHIEAFDLSGHINHNTAQYSAMFADVKARFDSDESVLYYTWAPNSTLTKGFGLSPGSQVNWIEVPSFSHPTVTDENVLRVPGVEGCVGDNDPCFMGFAANNIHVIANSEFLEKNPAAAKLFEVMRISLGDVLSQNNRMKAGEDRQKDIDNHAREWVALHQDLWNSWLEQARAAAAK